MVVGDDDQSIYRFRGASFAAFAEFDRRFARPPTHDPTATPPGPPPRLRLEQNFRSVRHVLTGANRLIARNGTRYVPDKDLRTERPDGEPIQVVTCGSPEDEAVAIVDAIKALAQPGEGSASRSAPSRSCTASTATARRSSPGCATRTSRTPSSVGCRCSTRPRSATSSRRCARSPIPTTTPRSSG